CHLIRPGSTEFKAIPDRQRPELPGLFNKLDPPTGDAHPELYRHETKYPKDDYYYPDHISWAGRDQFPYDHPKLFGTGPMLEVKSEDDEEPTKNIQVWLLQGLRFREGARKD